MVTFSKLGNFGRLGNSLFQIAATIGYARKHSMDYVLPKWKYAYAFNGLNQTDSIPKYQIYNEKSYSFNEIQENKGIDLMGYFQSEKYFKHCEKEIRNLLKPSEIIKNKIKPFDKFLSGNTCAVHIRRGDYITLNKYHNNLSMDYYKTAMSRIKADKYLVFSDDIEWCKSNITGHNITYIDSGDEIVDFFIMIKCKNFIIANSSYSWWASWLCDYSKKRIIAPFKNQWFTEYNKINVDDLYMSNWEFNVKPAVIIFHKDVSRYPLKWIDRCVNSIRNQTYQNFNVFELDYSGKGRQIYKGSTFINKKMLDHAKAHNYLLDFVFSKGYSCAFNVNVDDYYSLDRFEKQIKYIEQGYDVVSSNFHNVDEFDNITQAIKIDKLDFVIESKKKHNIIAHPVVCYSEKFWTTCSKLESSEIPTDDFELWKRSYETGKYKFIIIPEFLLFYRVSDLKVCNQTNSINKENNMPIIENDMPIIENNMPIIITRRLVC